MKASLRSLAKGVAASLIAAAIVGLVHHVRRDGDDSIEAATFQGWLGDHHQPAKDADLIDFVLAHEGERVQLDLHLGPEIADEFDRVAETATRTYLLPLSAFPKEPLLMDLHFIVEQGDAFFFGVESPGTAVLRGRFRIVGCAQTGTGWFSCELQTLPAEAH
jgi:hypothetical protein